MLRKLIVEICFEALAVRLLERNGRGHIEIMQEICDVEQNRMTGLRRQRPVNVLDPQFGHVKLSYLSNTEQSDCGLSAKQIALFCLYLLKAQATLGVEVVQAWPIPLLVFFRISFFQTGHTLRQLLQGFFKLARRLARE